MQWKCKIFKAAKCQKRSSERLCSLRAERSGVEWSEVAAGLVVLLFLSVCFFHAALSCLSCLSAHVYVCLPACLSLSVCPSVPRVLWDCRKVLITHMTSPPTSCLPCILGLSGLQNTFARLPLPRLPLVLRRLLFFSCRFPGLSLRCFASPPPPHPPHPFPSSPLRPLPFFRSQRLQAADSRRTAESHGVALRDFPDCAA